MLGYTIRRLLWVIPVLFTVGTITFALMHAAPGGPWDRAKPVPPQVKEQLNRRFGLDKPRWFNPEAMRAAARQGEGLGTQLAGLFDSQYWGYMRGAAGGNLGPSYKQQGRDVQQILAQKFPYSARLGLLALAFALLLGLPLGIISALRQNTLVDYLSLAIATLGVAVPSFVTGILLSILMSRVFQLPVYRTLEEWGSLKAYLLPSFVLGLGTMAYVTRLVRASMLEIRRQDYVRTAQAKGLSARAVIMRHMLRNALIPVVTFLGPAVVSLVTGSFIVEDIFGVPGMGSEFIRAVGGRDYSMIMGTTLFYAALVALGNLSVDLSYGLLDPRIRVRK